MLLLFNSWWKSSKIQDIERRIHEHIGKMRPESASWITSESLVAQGVIRASEAGKASQALQNLARSGVLSVSQGRYLPVGFPVK